MSKLLPYVAYIAVLAFACSTPAHDTSPRIEYTVDGVVDGYPAFSKLFRGDRIIAVDGAPLDRSLSVLVNEHHGGPVRLTYVRGGLTQEITLRPIGHMGNWTLGIQATRVDR